MGDLALLACGVFVVSAAGTWVMVRAGTSRGWVAAPRADRWHTRPVALHGSVGFYPAFLLGAGVFCCAGFRASGFDSDVTGGEREALSLALLGGAAVMFLVGFWDDLKTLRPATKLVFEVITASLFIFAGGTFELTGSYLVDAVLTYFWFIGIINAVNLLDNMDGLCSGIVVLSASTVAALTLPTAPAWHSQPAGPFALLLAAALLGFWLHNKPPAAIFMGDSGSLSIGFALAAVALPTKLNGFMGIQSAATPLRPLLTLLIPVAVVAIPIFDTTLVTITRKLASRKASQGGRDHSSHRLVGLGLSERGAVWLLYGFSATGGLIAILMQHLPDQTLPLCGLFLLALVFAGIYLGRAKVQVLDAGEQPARWTPMVANLLYKRHAAEVLLDTVLVILSLYSAYLLRFEGALASETLAALARSLPLVVPSCLVAFFASGIYRGQWRLISVADLPNHALGAAGGGALSVATVTLVTRFEGGYSRSAFIIFGVLLFLCLVGSRLSFRLVDHVLERRLSGRSERNGRAVLIYGADRNGKILYEVATGEREVNGYSVLGFIENDRLKTDRKLCGLPVKKEADWLRREWKEPPEIWVYAGSRTHLPDGLGSTWTIRRFRIASDTPARDGTAVEGVGSADREVEEVMAARSVLG